MCIAAVFTLARGACVFQRIHSIYRWALQRHELNYIRRNGHEIENRSEWISCSFSSAQENFSAAWILLRNGTYIARTKVARRFNVVHFGNVNFLQTETERKKQWKQAEK